MSEHGCESPLWVSVMSEVGTRSLRLLALLGTCLLLLAGIALGRFLAAVDTQETLDRMQAEIATLQTEVALSHQKSLQQESCLAQLQGRLELVRQAPLTRGWPVPTASAARLTQELQRTLTQRQCCLEELDSYTRRGRAIPSRHVVSFVDQLTAEHLGFVARWPPNRRFPWDRPRIPQTSRRWRFHHWRPHRGSNPRWLRRAHCRRPRAQVATRPRAVPASLRPAIQDWATCVCRSRQRPTR